MKKTVYLWIMAIIVMLGLYIFIPGFTKASSVYISNFDVSKDGTQIAIEVGVSSSAGYVRDIKTYQEHGGRLYLDCYKGFGGFNGSIGAKSNYIIHVDEDINVICLYKGNGSYQEVLVKGSNGIWQLKR